MPATAIVKNSLMGVNNILSILPKILSFSVTNPAVPNVVDAAVEVSHDSYSDDDIKHTVTLINYFLDNTNSDEQSIVTHKSVDTNRSIIACKTLENDVQHFKNTIITQHQSLADAFNNAHMLPANHFAYQFTRIIPQSNVPGLNVTLATLFETAFGFPVSLSLRPHVHIENKNRTQGLLAIQKNNLLLLDPEYAFHPQYGGDPKGIAAVSSVVRGCHARYSLAPSKQNDVAKKQVEAKPVNTLRNSL